MIRAYLFLIVKIILCGILQFIILACGIRTGSRKGVGNPANYCLYCCGHYRRVQLRNEVEALEEMKR